MDDHRGNHALGYNSPFFVGTSTVSSKLYVEYAEDFVKSTSKLAFLHTYYELQRAETMWDQNSASSQFATDDYEKAVSLTR